MKDIRQQFIEKRIRELQDSTDFVNSLLKCISGYSVIVGDFDGNIIVFNEGARNIFGFDPEEVVGLKTIEDFFPKSFVDGGKLNGLFDHLIAQGEYLYELERERKNGETFPGQSLLTLVRDNQDRLVGFVEITEDITERKRQEKIIKELYDTEIRQRQELEASEAFTQDLINHAPNPILVTDHDTSIIHANPAFEKITGFPLLEIIGEKTPYHWQSKDGMDIQSGCNINSVYDEADGHEQCYLNNKREPFWVLEKTESIIHDNRVRYYLSNWVDISLHKQAQEQLKKSNQKLLELDKIKDNLLNIAAHELRTPLTSIKCFTDLLMDYDEDHAKRKECLSIIQKETDRLINLINDFLDITKIQAGKMQWKKVEISIIDIIHQSINTNRPLIKESKLNLIAELEPELPPVLGDRDRLMQVMTNILGNAIKFTPDGGEIIIKSWLEKSESEDKNPEKIVVSITDTGIGIDSKNFSRIFENFGQVGETLKNRPKGTGLGLPICKKIVEYWGGNIWVESQLGKGSTFFFSLPTLKDKNPLTIEAAISLPMK